MKPILKILVASFLLFAINGHAKPERIRPPSSSTTKMNSSDYRTDLTVADKRPNSLSIEMLGRGGLYSLNYDRALGRGVSLGAGFSYIGVSTTLLVAEGGVKVLTIPLFVNIYPIGDSHRPFITAGITMVYASVAVESLSEVTDSVSKNTEQGLPDAVIEASAWLPLPVLGAGYEYRGRNGFLFRATPYITFVDKLYYWAGLTFGGTF
jgi:hypothetical protein